MADDAAVARWLEAFRGARRAFVRRLLLVPPEHQLTAPAAGEWSARDLVAHAAAWLEQANDRVPRLLAGAPSIQLDLDRFNAEAIARAGEWTPRMALAAFARAADRFEAIIGESDAADIADCPDALAWLRNQTRHLGNDHDSDIDRLAALFANPPPDAQ